MGRTIDLSTYVGQPWREPDFTCWSGTVCKPYRDILGIELSPHDTVPPLDRHAVAVATSANRQGWVEIESGRERPMDVILLVRGTHVGLVAGLGRMLTVSRGFSAVIEDYRGPIWGSHVDGFFRLAR